MIVTITTRSHLTCVFTPMHSEVPMWINRQPPIYICVVFQKFFYKLAIWNSVNHFWTMVCFQASNKTWLIWQTFTEHQFNSQDCWIRELWILGPDWRTLCHPEDSRREDMQRRKIQACPISPAFLKEKLLFPPISVFWAPSDFPGWAIHRSPCGSQSPLWPNLCPKMALPFKGPHAPEVKTGAPSLYHFWRI